MSQQALAQAWDKFQKRMKELEVKRLGLLREADRRFAERKRQQILKRLHNDREDT